jgi:hypothetical protein
MNQDSAGLEGGSTSGGRIAAKPRVLNDTHDPVYCGCTHPMHPDHVEKRRGVMMERYSCPKRRWWNAWHHPHAWMAPREGVPS